ncbi:hypothetical protein [Roseovarius sp.]
MRKPFQELNVAQLHIEPGRNAALNWFQHHGLILLKNSCLIEA